MSESDGVMQNETAALNPEVFDALLNCGLEGSIIHTLGPSQKPNSIVSIGPDGVCVETDASLGKSMGAQLVPAWMINVAVKELQDKGVLTNSRLLRDLNVKRSSFVMALLAQLPDVEVSAQRPITLRTVTEG